MIQAFMLVHPQSADLLPTVAYKTKHACIRRISCGTTKVSDADLSEAGDFHPTYASWNSSLFETSVILTIWEHAKELIGDNDVAIIHSDISLNHKAAATWRKVAKWLKEEPDRAIGLTAQASAAGVWEGWEVPADITNPSFDPMRVHPFEQNIRIWDLIKQYDPDIHEWAEDTKPRMIYSHQFACSRYTFDALGSRLYEVAQKLRLRDVGLWTPHMFERLVALYLARIGGKPVHSLCFWHHASSGSFGPGELSLYGPRPRKYYKFVTRWNRKGADDGEVTHSEAGYCPQPGSVEPVGLHWGRV